MKKKKIKKVKFPKKAKLIADGGFYQILPINNFTQRMILPIMRRIIINEPSIDHTELFRFDLEFDFRRIYKGYAEYRQVNCIRILNPKDDEKTKSKK